MLVKILILILLIYITYKIYNLYVKPESVLKSAMKKTKEENVSASVPEEQFYEIDSIDLDTILQLLNNKYIKYRYVNFNLSNLPVNTSKLKQKEANVLGQSITNVFNGTLKKANTKLSLLQVIPLYKMETDVESAYSIQGEFEVIALGKGVSVPNKILRLQLNIVVQKKDLGETFFDKVLIDTTPETSKKIEKIFITQIKRISNMDNYQEMIRPQPAIDISAELNRIKDIHANEMDNRYNVIDDDIKN